MELIFLIKILKFLLKKNSMFTGIIKSIGVIKSINSKHGDIQIEVSCVNSFAGSLSDGESVSINGVCLTIYDLKQDSFYVDVSNETLDKTNFSLLQSNYKVNLEDSLSLSDKLGGHLVYGHVDFVGKVVSIESDDRSWRYQLELNKNFTKYVVKKGSISVDGVSLTVNNIKDNVAEINIIPYTYEHTIFKTYKLNSLVNIEIDKIAVHIEKLIKE